MDTMTWYAQLIKPNWAPPAWVFGPAWTFLYVLIAASFGRVLVMAWRHEIPPMVALPFVLNLMFNAAFTPLQFGLRSNVWAMADIFCVLGTLIWAMVVIAPFARWILWIQVPYLLWVLFATSLQVAITFLNYQ